MTEGTYNKVTNRLKEAHYFLLSVVRKSAVEWEIVNLLEALIDGMEKRKSVLVEEEEVEV